MPDALLGIGGEACVFALDAERVARIHHANTAATSIDARTKLLERLEQSAHQINFAIPRVLETRLVEQRIVTIEPRLTGQTLLQALGRPFDEADRDGARRRAALMRAFLDAIATLGDLDVSGDGHRIPTYGDLCHADPIRTSTLLEYLERRARRNLSEAGGDFASIDAALLAAPFDQPIAPAFVHLDAYPGNVLVEGDAVTAVIDFGAVAIVGDRRFDPVAAAVYLTPHITPTATDFDRAVAREWLRERGLDRLYAPLERWLAAYWSFARDELRLQRWCRSVLRM